MEIKGTNIYLTRGDTARITYEVEIDANFIIEDLYFTVRVNSYSQQTLIEKEWHLDTEIPSVGIEKTEANKFSVYIAHEDTNTIEFGEYRYDVQINYSDSLQPTDPLEILTIVKPSIFSIKEEVTTRGV